MVTTEATSIGPSREDGIHEAHERDVAALFSLKNRSITELCAASYDAEVIADWVETNDRRTLGDAVRKKEISVAIRDGQVVGYIWNSWNKLLELMVDPNAIGQGVGSELLHYGLEKIGFSKWRVTTIEASLNAVGFYEKHGFVAGERVELENARTGRILPMIEMTLDQEDEDI